MMKHRTAYVMPEMPKKKANMVAASAKDAATMLAFCVVLQMGWSIASNASLTLWAVLTLR
jgi:hypothetical protein